MDLRNFQQAESDDDFEVLEFMTILFNFSPSKHGLKVLKLLMFNFTVHPTLCTPTKSSFISFHLNLHM